MKNSTIVFIFFAVVIHFVVGSIIAGNGSKKVYSIKDDEERDFQGAKQYCESKGKTLAVVRSAEEQELLEETIVNEGLWSSSFWLGGYYSSEKRKFMWIDSQDPEVTYAKWKHWGDHGGINVCISVSNNDRNGYRWRSEPCSRKTFFVCQQYV